MTTLAPSPIPTRTEALPIPRVDPITHLPILILYPHSRCNCRCLMCDIWRATTKDEIDPADVACWLNEWKSFGVQRVVLSGGEALMHSDLWSLCEHLRQANIGITLLSTGLLLKRHAENVVRYCDDVIVSLDGPREIHNHIRNIPRAYEKLAEGVAVVREQANSTKTKIAISARCTVQCANFRHLCGVVDVAHELSLDRVSFLAADVSSEAFNRPGGWDSERVAQVALTKEELPALALELDALERDYTADFVSGFIAESPLKLRRRLYQYFAALLGESDFYPNTCNAPWVSSVVEADGTVRPCFFQPPLGNIHHASDLNAILNSPEAIAWRKGLDMQRNEICRKCVCTLSLSAQR